MVGVAQLVERWLVVPEAAGSSPVVHPTEKNGLAKAGPFFRFRARRSFPGPAFIPGPL